MIEKIPSEGYVHWIGTAITGFSRMEPMQEFLHIDLQMLQTGRFHPEKTSTGFSVSAKQKTFESLSNHGFPNKLRRSNKNPGYLGIKLSVKQGNLI